jgi:hypothetical protein
MRNSRRQTMCAAARASPIPNSGQNDAPLARDPAIETRIDALLATMSLEQKVGQIVQGDIASVTPDDVRRYHLGSVLNGGNSDPGGRYNAPAKDWLALADAFYDASMAPDEIAAHSHHLGQRRRAWP